MSVTLRSLVADAGLGLQVVVAGGDRDAWDRPIPWAHGSDLPDPTPWLENGQLLLTNGAQFTPEHDADDYVGRLLVRGVLALAFATRVVHDTIPEDLVAACERAGLPLLEVPGHVPFIAIVRHVADGIAAERRRRLEWSLSAQRALARAALRADGLPAVLHELERRLDCWVGLFDAAGNRIPVRMTRAIPAALTAEVDEAVADVLRRGLRAGTRLPAGHGAITLQALGQRDEVRGVLAVGTALPPGNAESDLILSVIALASISVEQSRVLDMAGRDLRSGVLELLRAGTLTAARTIARRVGDTLPGRRCGSPRCPWTGSANPSATTSSGRPGTPGPGSSPSGTTGWSRSRPPGGPSGWRPCSPGTASRPGSPARVIGTASPPWPPRPRRPWRRRGAAGVRPGSTTCAATAWPACWPPTAAPRWPTGSWPDSPGRATARP